ncbi:pitrilysin family protein [Flammeovirga sp. EKP202]|uniref:M16 family metallopeptidase n=1 Tax=Flammeovirga sp. EKP202 TaxID=2770592 RepID=UPI00165EFE5D|nr:insulinase family protein [Flammeovirga sp. EKP202]MBD0404063.1 insulinase family protein [Flammeovirga sp. EKP202]
MQFVNAQIIPLNPSVKKKQLDNGFTYYIQKNTTPSKEVQFRLILNVGSILEDEDQRGFAHFLEHMAFNGSKHFPKNALIEYFQSIGVEFGGDINAYTGYDETVYMLPIPNNEKETLDNAFLFFSDILGGLTLDKEDIDAERGIIHEEWRTTTGLSDRLKKNMYPLLYYNSRYKDRLPIGLMDEVVMKQDNEEALRRFYRDWYRPDLATLLVIGDIDEEDIEKRVKASFSGITNPINERERVNYNIANHDQTLIKNIQDEEITSTSVKIITKIPKHKEKTVEDLKRSVANIIYTYLVNERLSEVSKQKGAAFMYAQSFAQGGSGDKGRYISTASVKSGSVIEGVEALQKELYRIKKYGFSSEEFERKKSIFEKDVKTSILEQSTLTSAQYINMLMNHVIYGEEYTSTEFKNKFLLDVINQITLDDIQRLADEYINDREKNRVVFVTAPSSEKIPTEQDVLKAINHINYDEITPYESEEIDAPLLTTLPQKGNVKKEEKDNVLGTTTLYYENGVKVILKPTTYKKDEIRFTGRRNGGYSLASDEDFNNATMANTLVELGGLGDFNQQQLEKVVGDKRVALSSFIHRYTEGVSGFSNVGDVETLLQLNYLMFTAPRKDRDQFDRFIENKKEFNKNSMNDPETYFTDEINKVMMENSPRTATLLTTNQLDELDLDKAYDFYKSRFNSANGMVFIMVGSFEVDHLKPLLDQYLGSLPSGPIVKKYKDHGIRPPHGKIVDVKKNTADKTKVILRFTGKYPTAQEDRIGIQLLSDIATIRLTKVIREEMGGAYAPFASVYVDNLPYSYYQFNILFTTSPDQAVELRSVALSVINDLKDEIKEEDIDKVKKSLLNHRSKSLENNGYWFKLLSNYNQRGEGREQFENYSKDVDKITAKKLQSIAKKYLKDSEVLTFMLSPQN